VKRYRLRFLLQEIDLVSATTVIGRGPECHVTIEDPLVSRQHARIMLDAEGALCEDLGSRNGVKLNGRPLRAATRLKDGDRLRIGTQELVFCEVREGQAALSKTTGFLRHCAKCHLPYPQELQSCPTCGSTEQLDDDTMTGELASPSEHSWSLQLLVEVLEKAVSMNRPVDVIRTLQRMATQIDERIQSGGKIDPKQLATVATSAVRASAAASDPGWVAWVLRVYARIGAVPPKLVTESLAELAMNHRATLRPAVEAVVVAARAAQPQPPLGPGPGRTEQDPDEVARLEQLLAAIDLADRANPDETATNPAVR
jgi:predicted component of type VI protein secretion system